MLLGKSNKLALKWALLPLYGIKEKKYLKIERLQGYFLVALLAKAYYFPHIFLEASSFFFMSISPPPHTHTHAHNQQKKLLFLS